VNSEYFIGNSWGNKFEVSEGDTTYYHYLEPAANSSVVDTLYSEDEKEVMEYTDFRFRPSFEYQVNKDIKIGATLEIGDLRFGNEYDGAAQGADGVNIATKSLFVDWTFMKNHSIKAGIQGYHDPMYMFADDDFAGVVYSANFIPELSTKVGMLVGREEFISDYDKQRDQKLDEEFDYGYSNFIFDANYKVNENLIIGINALHQYSVQDSTDRFWKYEKKTPNLTTPVLTDWIDAPLRINKYSNNTWIAPYVKGEVLENLEVEAEFVLNFRTAEFKVEEGALKDGTGLYPFIQYGDTLNVNDWFKDPEDQFGIAFMSKIKYKLNDQIKFGANFLYASGEEMSGKQEKTLATCAPDEGGNIPQPAELGVFNTFKSQTDYYKGATPGVSAFSQQTKMGLEILGTTGMNDSEGLNPTVIGEEFGVIMPVLFADYSFNEKYSVGVAAGVAMTAEEINYFTSDSELGSEKYDNKASYIGAEIDVNATLKFNDYITITPVAAFFLPGDMMQINKGGDLAGDEIRATEKAPMMYEIGLKAAVNF